MTVWLPDVVGAGLLFGEEDFEKEEIPTEVQKVALSAKGVPGHKPPVAGEHPRLFFRKGDLPAIRKSAKSARSVRLPRARPRTSRRRRTVPAR